MLSSKEVILIRKILTILVIAMLIALAGCGKQAATQEPQVPAAPSVPEAAPAPTEPVEPVEAPAETTTMPAEPEVEVVSTIPKDGATNSGPNQRMTITFMEDISGMDFDMVVSDGTEDIGGEVVKTGRIARFTPEKPLMPGTEYTVKLSGDINYQWSFTTV